MANGVRIPGIVGAWPTTPPLLPSASGTATRISPACARAKSVFRNALISRAGRVTVGVGEGSDPSWSSAGMAMDKAIGLWVHNAMSSGAAPTSQRSMPAAFGGGAIIGTLGGLIGLGGAEFRLPLLIGLFRFGALEAVILNKAINLVVVATALPFRAGTVSFGEIAANWPVILNLLAGSLAGAWLGARWATRLKPETLYKVLSALLVLIAVVLLFGHEPDAAGQLLSGSAQMAAGIVAGFGIGVVASLMGVAGGELLIPTLVLLFGADIKLAGSLSLAVSLPTMLVGFARYSQDQSFSVLGRNRVFLGVMAAGSIVGTIVGGFLLALIPGEILLPVLAAILLASAVKVWRHT